MKLVHPLLDRQIMIDESIINVLSVENPDFFCQLCMEINNQIHDIDGGWVLSDNHESMKFNKSVNNY